MGLIYNPSDSRGIVSALNGNIRTAEEMVEGLNRASRHLINALNGKELSGAAYTAGKGMFSQLVIPTISKASEALEKLKSETKKYEGFASSAGDELLDEDKLNEKLQSLQAQQAALSSQIDFFKQQAMSHKEDSGLSTSFTNYSNTLSSYMSTVADDIQEVQKKLKKLHEFNSNVNDLFKNSKDEIKSVIDMTFAFGLAEFDKSGNFILNVTSNGDLKRLQDIAKKMIGDAKKESFNTILEETIQDGVMTNADKAAKLASENIWKNRYTTELASGSIMGKTPGATAAAMKEAEELALNSGKNLGKCVSGGFAVFGGIMDGYADYQKDQDPGKAVAHGVLSTGGALGMAYVASFIPGPGWALAAGIVGGVVVSNIIDYTFEQQAVKKYFENIDTKVGNAVQGLSNFFGSVGEALSW
ncbi:hypothetical protein [Lactococcus garvieae]